MVVYCDENRKLLKVQVRSQKIEEAERQAEEYCKEFLGIDEPSVRVEEDEFHQFTDETGLSNEDVINVYYSSY